MTVYMVVTKLGEVNARRGEVLQFTRSGLAQRKRDHVTLETVRKEWQDLRASSSGASIDERHAHLIQDVRTMIRGSRRSGRTADKPTMSRVPFLNKRAA